MSPLLDRAVSEIEKLPVEEQDAFAHLILAELEDEALWAKFETILHYHQGDYSTPADYEALRIALLNETDAKRFFRFAVVANRVRNLGRRTHGSWSPENENRLGVAHNEINRDYAIGFLFRVEMEEFA